VLGGQPKETDRTRERDNQGVLQLQQQIMQEQDQDVEQLNQTVRRMKEVGIAINEELDEQKPLLEILDEDVDRSVVTLILICLLTFGQSRCETGYCKE
jgi:regulator of vacuolar morphogenesis